MMAFVFSPQHLSRNLYRPGFGDLDYQVFTSVDKSIKVSEANTGINLMWVKLKEIFHF